MTTKNQFPKALAETGSISLRGVVVALDSDVGQSFVEDCCRHVEGLLADTDLKTKWSLTDAELAALASNMPLLDAVRSERERRIGTGEAAREAAQRYFAAAPTVLNRILNNDQIAPRHRIEAAKELRQAAGHGDNADISKEKFIIHIDLGGGDKPLHYETEIARREPSLSDDGEQQ